MRDIPKSVEISASAWELLQFMVNRCRDVRENPEGWPLTPDAMAREIVWLHKQVKLIERDAAFQRTTVTDALKVYAEALERAKQGCNA